ncbi:MAG: hypothetical protein ACKVU4_14805 [Phycisphaerales bacterium]
MSGRVCYLGREESGALVAGVRVVGERLDEVWTPEPGANGAADPIARSRSAAAWVGDRLTQGRGAGGSGGRLRFVCVDVDGATCTWLTAPSANAAVIAAALGQAGADSEVDHGDGRTERTAWGVPTQGEASLQALAAPEHTKHPPRHAAPGRAAPPGRRLAVLAVPDTAARLFLDALDDRGVAPDLVVSLWHALALAWDPAGPAASALADRVAAGGGRVVATNTPPAAIVLVDPEGRLVWAWSRQGELLAGGAARIGGRGGSDAPDGVRVSRADVGRLTADWLGWSAQLGVAPTRIVCLTPRPPDGSDGLAPAELGEAIGRAWPGSSVDLAVHDDPVGATLHRLAELQGGGPEPAADPRAALVSLSHRPTAAHRSVLRWAAAAIAGAAIGLVGVAWRGWSAAGAIRAEIESAKDGTRTLIGRALPAAANNEFPMEVLEDEVTKLRTARSAGRDLEPAKPILNELDAISAVLSRDAQPVSLELINTSTAVTVLVPDFLAGQALLDSMNEVDGSSCEWRRADGAPQQQGDKVRLQFYGRWKSADELRAGKVAP